MRLSLIVCVYNTSHELVSDCLGSIYAEHGCEDFEVIFVDDGSTLDYSLFREKYPIRYVKIENRGHLGARLHGISLASGDYISFVDSDDSVSKNYHAPMLSEAEAHGTDIIVNGWAFHTQRTKRICTRDTTMKYEINARGDECLRLFSSQRGAEHSYYVLWNKIYRTELVRRAAKEVSLLVPKGERLTYGEDALFNFFCFKHAKSVKNVNTGLYFYRIHSEQSVVVTSKEKLLSQINCMSQVFRIMLQHAADNRHSVQICENLSAWQALMSRTHYSIARMQRQKQLYPLIAEAYGVKRLKMPTRRDGWFYSSSELLGDNFADVDRALAHLYYSEKPISAKYEKNSIYVSRSVEFARKSRGEISYSRKGPFVVPKRKVKLRDMIIHNPIVYGIGLLLFKKGSRLRAFLKKHL